MKEKMSKLEAQFKQLTMKSETQTDNTELQAESVSTGTRINTKKETLEIIIIVRYRNLYYNNNMHILMYVYTNKE